ncbi:MAG: TM2 domain-containing protein [Planctomycetaceae bacterium]|nr:TM2 domain-containing protein [Planctomycetaceae bacterium]
MADAGGKNKLTAALLAIFLGWIGAHHFYLGSSLAGIVCIAASWLTCGVGWLLAIVEGVLLLMMSDADFDAKYNQRVPEAMEFVFTGPKS